MIIRLNIAELAIRRKSGLLVTGGLGSCVGVALYDPVRKIAGLTHIFMHDSTLYNLTSENLLKYADTALPLMLDKMLREGALREELVAKIAGGSQFFDYNRIGREFDFSVGGKNILAVKKALKTLGVPLKGEDVGGNISRTMKLYVDSGKVEVISLSKGYKKVF